METTDKNAEIKKVRAALSINLIITGFAFIVFLRSINSPSTWRIVFASVGFCGFLVATLLILRRLMMLQKAGK